ncbi:MAG: hypothetical protein IJU32_01500 [Pyramidobacter sp.]|nr:hypothetical protein [Pyramidobacter sp.]
MSPTIRQGISSSGKEAKGPAIAGKFISVSLMKIAPPNGLFPHGGAFFSATIAANGGEANE